jgi:hypothetical protein
MILKKLKQIGVIAFAAFAGFLNSNATIYTFDVDASSGIGSGYFTIDLPEIWPGKIGRSTVIAASTVNGARIGGDGWVSVAISLNEPLESPNNAVLSGTSTRGQFSIAARGIALTPADAVDALPGVSLRTVEPQVSNHAPSLSCPAPATLQCNQGAVAELSVGVRDQEGDPLVVLWTVDGVKYQTNNVAAANSASGTTVGFTANFESGEHEVQVSVTDGKSSPVSCTTSLSVEDTTPPTVQSLAATPNVLKPADHRMVTVRVQANASDNCGPVTSKIKSVRSNEAIRGLGKGDLAPDWNITGDLTVQLRAERGPKGNGRIYTVTVESADAAGNTSTSDVTVTVP